MSGVLRLGTRGSRLALRQAEIVAEALSAAHPGIAVEQVIVRTVGDRVLDAPLSRIGGKGLFTKELESALEDGSIDLAVHSLKDLPTEIPAGLRIGAVLEREDPRDVLVTQDGRGLDELPPGARVGTSSLRRRAQLLAVRPDLRVEDLRGNVPTRLEKVVTGALDAVVLAGAGVLRLGMTERIAEILPVETMLPAVGQGAIAVEARDGDARIGALLAPLDHGPTRLATTAERALLARLEGGCQVPIGALAAFDTSARLIGVAGDAAAPPGAVGAAASPARERDARRAAPAGRVLVLRAVVADLDGRTLVRAVETGLIAAASSTMTSPALPPSLATPALPVEAASLDAATALGERCAERLVERGAGPILERIFELARRGAVPEGGAPEDGP